MQCNGILLHRQHFQVLRLLWRHINVSSTLLLKSQDNLVRKFLMNNNATKKRRTWHDSRMMLNPSELARPQMKGEKNSHRINVLNKVFMNKICDLLSTGRISSLFTGYGLEIAKVEVLPGVIGINVHWFCTGSDIDNKLEKILQENAFKLRHELSQQRVVGRVPPIQFVKDRRYYKLMEVERLLARADFGEAFEPADPTHHVKATVVLEEKFDDNIKSVLEVSEDEESHDFFLQALSLASSSSSETEEPADDLPPDLPAMRDNVLGVDTSKVFNLVRQGVTRARAEHRKHPEGSPLSNPALYSTQEIGSHNLTSRTLEIRQWATKYEELRRKEKRSKNKEDALLMSPPEYVEDSNEDMVYEEEEDFFDENFELDTREKI